MLLLFSWRRRQHQCRIVFVLWLLQQRFVVTGNRAYGAVAAVSGNDADSCRRRRYGVADARERCDRPDALRKKLFAGAKAQRFVFGRLTVPFQLAQCPRIASAWNYERRSDRAAVFGAEPTNSVRRRSAVAFFAFFAVALAKQDQRPPAGFFDAFLLTFRHFEIQSIVARVDVF